MYLEDIAAFVPRTPAEAADKEQILYYVNQYVDTILTRENRLAHITASGFILSADGQWVLMAHHNIYKVWAWTGGHADGEADLLAVALREAREETGAGHIRPLSSAIASVEILPVWGHEKRGIYVPARRQAFGADQRMADGGGIYQAAGAGEDPAGIREGPARGGELLRAFSRQRLTPGGEEGHRMAQHHRKEDAGTRVPADCT